MSLSRAFTTRRSRKPSDVDVSAFIPQRSLTTKHPFSPGTVRHQKISAPIELISTTNMLSYNAPDIYPRGRSSTTSSNSDGGSINSSSDTAPSSVESPLTSPELSRESSPTTSSPEPNHLSCYFGQSTASDDDAPMIPTRALSHTKVSAEYLARKRSISRMSSSKNSISSKTSIPPIRTARSSFSMFNPNPEVSEHPFGNELAQVSELAEEYSSSQEKLMIVDEEEQELVASGLFKFRAEDYMSELQGLFSNIFGEKPQMSSPAMWI